MTSHDNLALYDLAALQALGAQTKPEKPSWCPPVLTDIPPGKVLAFDQSLSGCAAVALASSGSGLSVLQSVSFKTSHVAQGGWEESLQRAVQLEMLIRRWLGGLGLSTEWRVVHEQPPIGGGKLVRPESSALAALSVRNATDGYLWLPMVAAQAHKKFVCGNSNATKIEHHVALKRLMADWPIGNAKMVSNADQRDALSIAMVALARA